jgi:hypothetical protein
MDESLPGFIQNRALQRTPRASASVPCRHVTPWLHWIKMINPSEFWDPCQPIVSLAATCFLLAILGTHPRSGEDFFIQ